MAYYFTMERIVLGIDPGIADTGYGLIRIKLGQEPECLAYGSIKTRKEEALSSRLKVLSLELSKIIKKYKPQVAAIEQLFFNKNVKTAFTVGQARGVVLLTLADLGLKVLEFTPAQVKQGVCAYGQADKKQVQKMVKILLKLKEIPKPDDAADALAIALCASNIKF